MVSGYKQKYEHSIPAYQESEANSALRKIRRNNETLRQKNLQFTEFLWLITKSRMRSDPHWLSYEKRCRPCNVHYDFIGHLETSHEDLPHIMTTAFNVSKTYAVQREKYGRTHATNSTLIKVQKYIGNLTATERGMLYEHCHHDSQMFGYTMDNLITRPRIP